MGTYLNGKLVMEPHGHTSPVDGAILNQPGVLDGTIFYGTVSVAAGTPDVVGDGTFFGFYVPAGARVSIAGEIFRVLSVADDTHLTLDGNHVAGAAGVEMYKERGNTAHGTEALMETIAGGGYECTAFGYRAGAKYTDIYNPITAFGWNALGSAVSAAACVAFGWGALKACTTGILNSAVGIGSLQGVVDGTRNTAVGDSTMPNTVSGDGNTALGQAAGLLNVTGSRNLFLGWEAGLSETGSDKLYIANGREDADVLIKGDFATRLIGLGTVDPSAMLHFVGALTSALTGTVTVTINTPDVVGDGTAFDTELYAGDAIKILDEVFTVSAIADATHLTLDSDHLVGASGDPAYQDPDLLKVQNGDGSDRFVVDKSGFATVRPVWDDLRVPLVGVQAGGLKPPAWAQFMDDGAGSVGVYGWAFGDEAVEANEEQLFFAAQLPHTYKEGTDIRVHVHWSPAIGGAAGEFVKWGLEYTWVNINGTYGNTAIITSDASSADAATTSEDASMVADKHYVTKIGVISGAGQTISSMLVCRVFRNSSHADDDLAEDAFGLEIDFHHQVDTMGSRQELIK